MTAGDVMARVFQLACRTGILAACAAGLWWSGRIARADYFFRQDTAASIRAAIGLVPDQPDYYLRLVPLDEPHAERWLETALRLDRYSAPALIELGLRAEARGDPAHAEAMLLRAFDYDRTYLPRWTLANYYYRRGNLPSFWQWARKAAQMPAQDLAPLFLLCWRAAPDPAQIAGHILVDDPSTVRQFLAFLLLKEALPTAAAVAPRLVRLGRPEADRNLLFLLVDRLVAAGQASAATALWQLLSDAGWVPADPGLPHNPTFAREPLPVALDWSLTATEGLNSLPGPSGLIVQFSGRQPESCNVVEQAVALVPGLYEFRCTHQTSDIPPGSGLRWNLSDAGSGEVLATSADLSNASPGERTMRFEIAAAPRVVRLRLGYRRAIGTPRVAGTVVLISTHLRRITTP
jgi:tetratricopeptide (TPR) repeat protein